MKPTLLFDTSALIAATRFRVNEQPIIEHILAHCEVIIPQIVKVEVVDNGLARFPLSTGIYQPFISKN